MAFFILTLGKKGAAKRTPSVKQMRNQDECIGAANGKRIGAANGVFHFDSWKEGSCEATPFGKSDVNSKVAVLSGLLLVKKRCG